jgi:PST family polysaccharide transporter
MSKSILNKTATGIFWSLSGQVGGQLVRVGTILILARFFLAPSDFGLVNIFVAITGFSKILIDFGFSQALVQKKEVSQEDYSTVFWTNIVICTLVTVGLILFASRIAGFYKIPKLYNIILILSPLYFFEGLISVQRLMLQKELNFKVLSSVEFISILTAGILSCFMGYTGYGIWSLVAFYLCTPVVTAGILWFFAGNWRPNFVYSIDSLKGIFNFSMYLLGNSTLNYWSRNIDKVLVGKYIGETALGYYSQAYSLVLIPVSNFSNSLSRVMFPAFSEMQGDNEMLPKIFVQVSKAVLFINLPVFLILNLAAEPFVNTLLGEKWLSMTSVLRIFAFVGLMMSIRTIHSIVFMSQNRNDLLLKINLVFRIFMILGFLYFTRKGIEKTALWLLFSMVLSYFSTAFFSCRILNIGFLSFARDHFKTIAAGVLSYLILRILDTQYSFFTLLGQNSLLQLIIIGSSFAALFLLFIHFSGEEILPKMINQVKARLRKK